MQSVWSAQQIQGARDYQEDVFAVIEQGKVFFTTEIVEIEKDLFPQHQTLYLLTDGMGGMGHGDIAAREVSNEFIEAYLQEKLQGKNVAVSLSNALIFANEHLKIMVEEEPQYKNMGCTLLAVLWDSHLKVISWLSVGDSPFWLYRKGGLRQLNEKHTWGELIKRKENRGEEIDSEKYKDYLDALNSAVDGNEIEHIDLKTDFQLNNGDIFLLASDGMETLPLDYIESEMGIVSHQIQLASNWSEAYETLSQVRSSLMKKIKSNNYSYQDNATLIISCVFNNKLEILTTENTNII
jgi:serine/threonine protein phosphatase PrpC